MKKHTWGYIIICSTIISIFLLTGCSKKEIPKKPPDKVTVQLKWVHQAQFAGLYLANEKGYYADQNITVEFVEGSSKINMVDEVVSGNAQFGITAPEHIISANAKGKSVKAIAAVFRRNPLVFASLKGSGIRKPSDFMGKSIATTKDGRSQLMAVMSNLDLDFNRINILPYDYSLKTFMNGEIDIASGYSTGGIMRVLNKGYELNIILPSDYGIHLYSDTLFTSADTVESNPDLVLRFLGASLKGWQYAIENPEEAVKATMKYAREKDIELQTKMMEAQLPLVHTGEDRIGWMRAEIWEGMHQLLLDQDRLEKPIDLSKVYTMSFLENIYGSNP